MPIYAYKGLNKSGKEVSAELTVDSIAQAKSKLKTDGIMLLEIKEQKAKSNKNPGGGMSLSFGGGVNVEELALMTRQFSTLVKARIQIVQALSALVDQVDNAQLKLVLSEVKQKVNEGSSLSKAMAEYPKIFSTVYTNMVDAGESSGTLDVVLLRLADFTEAQVKLKNKIKSAMMYPVIMMLVGSAMIGVIFTVVIPKITKIFINSKKAIPTTTQIAIAISNFLQDYWMVIIAAVPVSIWLFRKWASTKKGERIWHKFLLKAPVLGNLVTMINLSRFCSTLATLLSSGVPILTAMRIVKNLIPNVVLKDVVEKSREFVQEGKSIVPPLKDSGHFPPMVTHMIALGEKSGELEPMLKIVSENYEDQVNNKLEGLTSILEPIMMVALGGVVGFVVFAVIIPMLELNKLN